MTRRSAFTASLMALLSALAASPARLAAQSGNTQFNIAAGLTLPTGTFADRNDAGYHAIVGLGIAQHGSPLGFRAEGIYNEFNEKSTDGKAHVGGVTGNVIYNLVAPTSGSSNTLYVIGGVGYYSTREPEPPFNLPSRTDVGWNFGGGFRFPLGGFSGYLEARYHAVGNTSVRLLPISFGLVF